MNKIDGLILSALTAAFLVGCGGGGSESSSGTTTPTTPTTSTGTFIDAPVKGLHYKTATQDGYTNENGEFKYIAGEKIEFKLGNLSLGSVDADSLITPYTLENNSDILNPGTKATNIALLLQNFDTDRADGILDITNIKDMDLSSFKFDDALLDMEAKISAKLADNGFVTTSKVGSTTLISSDAAKETMKNYIAQNGVKYNKKFTQAYLNQVVFYTIENTDGDDKPVTPYILVRKFRDGIFYGDDSGTSSGGSGFENWGTYTIENGVIKLTDGIDHEQFKVTAVGDGYIEGEIHGKSSILYTDKTKAEAALSGSTTSSISVETGFTTVWLEGRTLWTVADEKVSQFTFSGGKNAIVGQSYNQDYTVMSDGILRVDETSLNDGVETYEYYKILDINGGKISTSEGENLTNVKNRTVANQEFFTNEDDAQNFLDSL